MRDKTAQCLMKCAHEETALVEAQSAIIEQHEEKDKNAYLHETAEAVNSQKSAHQSLTLSLAHSLS